MLVKQLIEV